MRPSPFLAVLASCLLLLFQTPVQASVDIWHEISPHGITTTTVAADPSDPQRLLAAGDGHGLFLSEDGGISWNPVVGLDRFYISALAFDPQDPRRVYAGSSDGQVYASDDGGRHWTALLDGDDLIGGQVRQIFVSPADPQRLYVNRVGNLIASEDRGRNWAILPLGPGDPYPISTVAIDPRDADSLLVSGRDITGVFRSRDGGQSWTVATPDGGGALSSLAISPRDGRALGSRFTGELWVSVDGGSQWQRISAVPPNLRQVAFDGGGRAYASTATGLYISDDGGLNWFMSTAPVVGLDALQSGGGLVSARSDDPLDATLLLSRDGGQSWTQRLADVDADPWPEPLLDELLYTGFTAFGSFSSAVILYLSENGGDAWEVLMELFTSVGDVTPIPYLNDDLQWRDSAPEILYAPVAPPRSGDGDPGRGLLRSMDGGLIWSLLGPFDDVAVASILLDPDDPGFIAAGGAQWPASPLGPAGVVAWSRDGGAQWQRTVLNGVAQVADLLRDPQDPGALLVATDRGIWRLSDMTAAVDLSGRPDWPVAALAGSQERLVAAVSGATRGLAISEDSGAGWQFIPLAILAEHPPVGLEMDPQDSDHLWLATGPMVDASSLDRPSVGGGIYESLDGGLSWQSLNTGLSRNLLSGLRLSPSGGLLLTDAFAMPLQRSVLWWEPERAGMGVALEQNGETIWGTLYYYDAGGEPRWALFTGTLEGKRLEADLLAFNGPAPGEVWDIHRVQSRVVGQVSLQFQSALAGRLDMVLDGVADSLVIQPFIADASGTANRIWWQPSASGQGLAVVQRGDYLNGAWYFYDDQGQPTWRVFEGELVDGVLAASLLDFRGPALGSPWDAMGVSSEVGGEVRFSVERAARARFEYRLDGVEGVLALQPFLR